MNAGFESEQKPSKIDLRMEHKGKQKTLENFRFQGFWKRMRDSNLLKKSINWQTTAFGIIKFRSVFKMYAMYQLERT